MKDKRLRITISDEGNSREFDFELSRRKREELILPETSPWWTHDFGEPKLYDIKVQIIDINGSSSLSEKFKTGFRAIKLLRERDRLGESFIFELNGKKVFIKGANWIPSDSFLPRVRPGDYRAMVQAAREANMNMLRIWGGGIYEDEEFYRSCDENGILVWQDFMFACASYPEYDAFLKQVEFEATENTERISNHPCAAIFCGNNEAEWIWKLKTGKTINQMPGRAIFGKMLRDVVKKVAPEVPYWPSSPFGGENPNSERMGDHHQWEIWSSYKPPSLYGENTARFVSEFGFQAPPSPATFETFTVPGDRDLQSPVMRAHNKQVEGTERLFRFLAGEVKIAGTFEDVVLQMQLVQAKAIKTGVANWRSRKWNTAGTIFWQLNDCWPVSSWSAIDYTKRPKALYYWAKKFYKPIKIFIENENWRLSIALVNDTLNPVFGELNMTILDLRGNVVAAADKHVRLRSNSVARFPFEKFPSERRGRLIVEARFTEDGKEEPADEEQDILVPWLDFNFEVPKVEMQLEKVNGGTRIALTSDLFVQGVYLPLGEEVGQLSDNFLTLMPGRSKMIFYRKSIIRNEFDIRLPLLCQPSGSAIGDSPSVQV